MKKYISVAIGVLIVSCVFSPKKQTTMNELLPNDWVELPVSYTHLTLPTTEYV